jgi:hypothetical protein
MGRVMADVPAASYFYWLHKGRAMGESNLWRHREFVNDFLRDNPQFAVRYRSAKPAQRLDATNAKRTPGHRAGQ